jgi:glycosyltransferase involved in cell wall biosynthesis
MEKLYDIPKEKLVTFPNGINLERFLGKEVKRQKNKFIWSSSPDRGLDVVLDMWPMIRKMLPGAELHVFYGWNNYDKVVEWTNDPYMKLFKKGVIDRVKALENEKGGVYMRGRVDQDTLAEEFLSAEYLPYFGYFLETNCITALEAQAAGCVPFITNIGGAPENISSAGVVLDGFPNNFTYREQAMKALKEIATRTPKEKEEDEETMKDFVKTKTWDDCFSYWLWVAASEKANNKLEQVA